MVSQIEAYIGSSNTDAVIRSMIQTIYQSLDIDVVFQEIVRTVGIYLQADRCFIAKFDEKSGTLSAPTKEYRSSGDVASMLEALPELWLVLSELAVEICPYDGPIEFNALPGLTPEVQAQLGHIKVQSGLACTIRFQNNCSAVLFIHQVKEKRKWSEAEKEIVQIAAMHSAVAIHHAALYAEVQAQSERHENITQLYMEAIKGVELQELYTLALNLVSETMNVEFCKILEISHDPARFQIRAISGFNSELLGQAFDLGGEPHASYTLKSLCPIMVEDIYTDTRFKPSPLHYHYKLVSGITAVIYGEKGPYGILQADSHLKRVFTLEDAYFMRSVANIIGMTVERKHAEQEIEASHLKLQQRNKDLEIFASIAAHDLKAPLRKIGFFSEHLYEHSKEKLHEEALDDLRRIQRSVQNMQTLIDDLLALAKTTQEDLSFEEIDLNKLVCQVLGDLSPQIREKVAQVEVSVPLTVWGEPSQIQQLIQNLLDNALKFQSPHAIPVIKIRARCISEKMGELTVEDNGIGFPQEKAEKLFVAFERLNSQAQYPGTGLGLAICQRIVERHGGTIQVKSQPGQGSTFSVTLPVVYSSCAEASG
jgi:signal transduction histidine kinase